MPLPTPKVYLNNALTQAQAHVQIVSFVANSCIYIQFPKFNKMNKIISSTTKVNDQDSYQNHDQHGDKN